MRSFDLISDLHLDSYIRDYWDWDKEGTPTEEEIIAEFVDAITPTSPSPVLVIAGDLGHKNSQSHLLLSCLSEKYDYVLFTNGNHDLYLLPDEKEHRIYHNSIERWLELKEITKKIPGVVFLDGNRITINGVTFGGTCLWYDFSHGIKQGYSREKLEKYWLSSSRDSVFITECPKYDDEKEKLRKIYDLCDVIITHVSPDDSRINPRLRSNPLAAFYYFDGSEFLANAKGKIWCFGHVHHRQMYHNQGCLLVNNALGYSRELPFTKSLTVKI